MKRELTKILIVNKFSKAFIIFNKNYKLKGDTIGKDLIE